MKLGDIDIDILVQALRQERSEWLDIPRVENRRPTEAAKATVCVLYALERALGKATSAQEGREEENQRVENIRSQPFDETVLDGLAKAIGDGEPEGRS